MIIVGTRPRKEVGDNIGAHQHRRRDGARCARKDHVQIGHLGALRQRSEERSIIPREDMRQRGERFHFAVKDTGQTRAAHIEVHQQRLLPRLRIGNGEVGRRARLSLARLRGHTENGLGHIVIARRIEQVAQACHRFRILREGIVVHGQRHLRTLLAAQMRENGQRLQAQALLDIRHAHELILHLVKQQDKECAEDDADQTARRKDNVRVGADRFFRQHRLADNLDCSGIFIGLQFRHAHTGTEVGGLCHFDFTRTFQLLNRHLCGNNLGIQCNQTCTECLHFLNHRAALPLQKGELRLAGIIRPVRCFHELTAVDLLFTRLQLHIRVIFRQARQECLAGDSHLLPALKRCSNFRRARNTLGQGAELCGVVFDNIQRREQFRSVHNFRFKRIGPRFQSRETALGILAFTQKRLHLAALAQIEQIGLHLRQNMLLIIKHRRQPRHRRLGSSLVLFTHERLARCDYRIGQIRRQRRVLCRHRHAHQARHRHQVHCHLLAENMQQFLRGHCRTAVFRTVKIDNRLVDRLRIKLFATCIEHFLQRRGRAIAALIGIHLPLNKRRTADAHLIESFRLPLRRKQLENNKRRQKPQNQKDENRHPVAGTHTQNTPDAERACPFIGRILLSAIRVAISTAIRTCAVNRSTIRAAATAHCLRSITVIIQTAPSLFATLCHCPSILSK